MVPRGRAKRVMGKLYTLMGRHNPRQLQTKLTFIKYHDIIPWLNWLLTDQRYRDMQPCHTWRNWIQSEASTFERTPTQCHVVYWEIINKRPPVVNSWRTHEEKCNEGLQNHRPLPEKWGTATVYRLRPGGSQEELEAVKPSVDHQHQLLA